MTDRFNAIVAEDVDGKTRAALKSISLAELPDEEVLVQVAYSTLNYKDGLAVSGKGRICRSLPLIHGHQSSHMSLRMQPTQSVGESEQFELTGVVADKGLVEVEVVHHDAAPDGRLGQAASVVGVGHVPTIELGLPFGSRLPHHLLAKPRLERRQFAGRKLVALQVE